MLVKLCTIALFVDLLHLRFGGQAHAEPQIGRATFYGHGDGFTLNDGSCACHKQWGFLSNRCESGHCFDYIGKPTALSFCAAIH